MRTVSGAQHWRRKTGKLSSEPCLFDLRSAVSTNLDFRKQKTELSSDVLTETKNILYNLETKLYLCFRLQIVTEFQLVGISYCLYFKKLLCDSVENSGIYHPSLNPGFGHLPLCHCI